ncbi:hypothetical protein FKM82_007181 [Ascaphus truei]
MPSLTSGTSMDVIVSNIRGGVTDQKISHGDPRYKTKNAQVNICRVATKCHLICNMAGIITPPYKVLPNTLIEKYKQTKQIKKPLYYKTRDMN